MEENTKAYAVMGTVTIGTDEYRDLIETAIKAEKKIDEEHTRWYNEYCSHRKTEEENKKLKEENAKLRKIISKKGLINEEGISVFMTMFGEED